MKMHNQIKLVGTYFIISSLNPFLISTPLSAFSERQPQLQETAFGVETSATLQNNSAQLTTLSSSNAYSEHVSNDQQQIQLDNAIIMSQPSVQLQPLAAFRPHQMAANIQPLVKQ